MRLSCVLMLVLWGASRVATAQEAGEGAGPRVTPRVRVAVGLDANYGMATGDFGRAVDHGWGLVTRLSLSRGNNPLGLAFEASYLEYGNDTVRRPLFGDTERVLVDVSTSNWIGHVSLGPELVRRSGAMRPYVRALVGLSYFSTATSVEGSADAAPFATTTHLDDTQLSGVVSGGVRFPLSRDGHIALDLNARYVLNGNTRYLVEGDVRELPDGRLEFTPRRTSANLAVLGIGFTVTR